MTNASNREIGRRIAALRQERGWSQSFLASLVGMDQSALSRLEAGKRKTAAAELDRLARVLDVEASGLLEELETTYSTLAFGADGLSRPPHGIADRLPPEASRPLPRERSARDSEAAAAMPPPREVSEQADMGEITLMEDASADVERGEGVADALYVASERGMRGARGYAAGEPLDLASFVPGDVAEFERMVVRPRARDSELQSPPTTQHVTHGLASLPPPVAAVIADYLRLRAASAGAPSSRTASWASVDSLGRRRAAPKPTGRLAGRTAALSWREPRDRYARLWRHELGIGVDGPAPDLVALFEDAGVAEVIVGRLESDEPVCAGVTLPGDPGGFPDDVSFLFVNANRPVTLQRHALVHAFGHLALGHGDVVDRRIEWSRATPLEMEANDFAEEFLAPADAVARWYGRRGDPRPSVEVLLELAAAFGITFWAAYYRSRAAGRLGDRTQGRLMQELRARQWELLPEQSYRGGLRDTLSTLSEESPPPPPGAVGVGGVRPHLTREQTATAGGAPLAEGASTVVRVPSRLRVWTLQALRGGRLSLEQAAAVLHRWPADLAVELRRLGLE